MYQLGDKVRVFWEKELYPTEMEIVWVSDDEEWFELESEDKTIVMQNVKRENIFEGWERDKLARCMLKDNWEIVEKVADDGELAEAYQNNFQNKETIILFDKNWEALAETIAYNMDSLLSLYEWMEKLFSYYSACRFLYCKETDMYYLFLK